jgi:hypothetical protein
VRIDPWDTGFVDLDGEQGLLGQREGRTGATVVAWLSERGSAFREAVEYVAIDRPPHTPGRSARPICCPTRRSWWTTSTW